MFVSFVDVVRQEYRFHNTTFNIDLNLTSAHHGRILSSNYPEAGMLSSTLKLINLPNLFWFRINVTVRRNGGACPSSPIKFVLSGSDSGPIVWTPGGCDAEASRYTNQTVFTIQSSQRYLKMETVRFANNTIPAFDVTYDGKLILIYGKFELIKGVAPYKIVVVL